MSSKFLGTATVCFSLMSLPGLALAQADAIQPLSAAACQPLTADNIVPCCAAENWNELVLKDDVRFCPPLNVTETNGTETNATENFSGRLGQELVAGDVDEILTGGVADLTETPIAATAPIAATDGNPGNDISVGSSGEKEAAGMAENDTDPVSGEQGKSN